MALTLIKEDGTGLPEPLDPTLKGGIGKWNGPANTYANEADGTDYFYGSVHETAWAEADTTAHEWGLRRATLLIDALCLFRGRRRFHFQGLQWPRTGCIDYDAGDGQPFPPDEIPQGIINATCEMAGALIAENRTANPEGEGLRYQWDYAQTDATAATSHKVGYRATDRPPILTRAAIALLAKFGAVTKTGQSMSVPVQKV